LAFADADIPASGIGVASSPPDPVRFDVEYPDEPRNRLTVFFRLLLASPMLLLLAVLPGSTGLNFSTGSWPTDTPATDFDWESGIGAAVRDMHESGALVPVVAVMVVALVVVVLLLAGYGMASDGAAMFVPVLAMLLLRGKYPTWWFEWNRAFAQFTSRVMVYLYLLRDEYPSTDEEQAVHFQIDPPNVAQLSGGMPLIKWLLATPHYFLLGLVGVTASLLTFASWFAILLVGRQPRPLFDFVVATMWWGKRVAGYATLLITDDYPRAGLGLGTGVTLVAILVGALLSAIAALGITWGTLAVIGALLSAESFPGSGVA
jgi:hypothetical protein